MWVVVPIKTLARAKQRLASILTPVQREQLMVCMVEDVLAASSATPGLSGLAVVSADTRVHGLAARFGARCLIETGQAGLCAALQQAAAVLTTEGVRDLLILPADVPLLTADVVAQVFAVHHQMTAFTPVAVTLVPASTDGGTNALALSPPNLIAPAFGFNSFRRHCASARAQGIYPGIVRIPELGLDIDSEDNLIELLRQPTRTRTQYYLRETGLAESLLAHREPLLQGEQAG
ncbi:MAG: 2-phospho-L-lactate guanylyltransferase [Porticoccaceae bacterium]